MKIRPVEAEMFHAIGGTEEQIDMTKANILFSQLCESEVFKTTASFKG
jgi:hypothetical protein